MDENSSKIYFVSLGCPKNKVDSEVMIGHANQGGYEVAQTPEDAGVMVVNTCGFIESAKEESIDAILELVEIKKKSSNKRLIVTGCLSQRYGEELAKEIPEVDCFLGSADYDKFAGVISNRAPSFVQSKKKLPILNISKTPDYIYDHNTPRMLTGQHYSAHVKIAEGCDRPCSFCIIPKLRGAQRSRTIDSIYKEVSNLSKQGVREINLIAQDLTRYGKDLNDDTTLAQLLEKLGEASAVDWIRLHYTYPSAFNEHLISVIKNTSNVAKYIDVPMQHIDDDMLKLMRRGHTSKATRRLVEDLRSEIDGVVIRSTFIVGHPGETDASFRMLCDFLEEAKLDHVGAFTYSSENGTHSATLEDVVPADVAIERKNIVMALQKSISEKKNKEREGHVYDVLVERESSESEYLMEGRWYGQAPEIDGLVYLTDCDAAVGELVKAKVTQSTAYELVASANSERW